MLLFKKLAITTLGILFSVSLVGCDISSTQQNEVKITGKTMGTFYNITVVGDYPGGAEQLKHEADEVLAVLNKEMSIFDKNSMLSKFNQHNSTEPMEISSNLADVIIASIRVGYLLNGATDITIEPLVSAWGFGPDKLAKFPNKEEIAQAKAKTGLDKLHVEVSANKATIRKDIPDLTVDLATVGEGFGADKLAELMDSRGINNYMVAVAGAIRSKGHNSRGTDWVVGIEHPSNELDVGKHYDIPVCTRGQAISTSGSYRNYVIGKDGKRKTHIIDPTSGEPINHNTVSITVIGPSALWTDAIDTGLMVWGSEKALSFANDRNIAIYTIVKTEDGFKSHYSRAMQKYLDCK